MFGSVHVQSIPGLHPNQNPRYSKTTSLYVPNKFIEVPEKYQYKEKLGKRIVHKNTERYGVLKEQPVVTNLPISFSIQNPILQPIINDIRNAPSNETMPSFYTPPSPQGSAPDLMSTSSSSSSGSSKDIRTSLLQTLNEDINQIRNNIEQQQLNNARLAEHQNILAKDFRNLNSGIQGRYHDISTGMSDLNSRLNANIEAINNSLFESENNLNQRQADYERRTADITEKIRSVNENLGRLKKDNIGEEKELEQMNELRNQYEEQLKNFESERNSDLQQLQNEISKLKAEKQYHESNSEKLNYVNKTLNDTINTDRMKFQTYMEELMQQQSSSRDNEQLPSSSRDNTIPQSPPPAYDFKEFSTSNPPIFGSRSPRTPDKAVPLLPLKRKNSSDNQSFVKKQNIRTDLLYPNQLIETASEVADYLSNIDPQASSLLLQESLDMASVNAMSNYMEWVSTRSETQASFESFDDYSVSMDTVAAEYNGGTFWDRHRPVPNSNLVDNMSVGTVHSSSTLSQQSPAMMGTPPSPALMAYPPSPALMTSPPSPALMEQLQTIQDIQTNGVAPANIRPRRNIPRVNYAESSSSNSSL